MRVWVDCDPFIKERKNEKYQCAKSFREPSFITQYGVEP